MINFHSSGLRRSFCSTAGHFRDGPSMIHFLGRWDAISSSAKRVSRTASHTCQQLHATHQGDFKTTPHSLTRPGIKDFYSDPDEDVKPGWTWCLYILLCDLNRPGQTLVGSHYPPPSLPQTLADTHTDTHRRAVIFHPAQWASDRSGRGSASVEGRLAGLTPPYSPVNYGHLLGRPSLGAFQGPWLLP